MKVIFILTSLLVTNAYASSLDGYWVKYENIVKYGSGELEKSYQVKKLIKFDQVDNLYTIEVTDISVDGKVLDQFKEVEDDFISPEVGSQIVSECLNIGGVIKLEPLGGSNIKVCSLKKDGLGFSFAAVPFGQYDFIADLEVESPDGSVVKHRILQKLIEHGKD